MARAALTQNLLDELNYRGPFTGFGNHIVDIEQAGFLVRAVWNNPILGTPTALLPATALQAAPITGTVFAGQPDSYRNVTLTVALGGGSLVGNVVLTGTDNRGNVISESIAVSTATLYQSTLAYQTLTSYSFPARTTAGDTISIGTGNRLGLPRVLFTDTGLFFMCNGVKEAYTLSPVPNPATPAVANLILPTTGLSPAGANSYKFVFLDERAAN